MPTITKRQKKRLWVISNYGKLARIAESLAVTRSAVQAVFMYELRSRNLRIERALAEAEAPFMSALLKRRESEGQTDSEYKAMQRRLKRA